MRVYKSFWSFTRIYPLEKYIYICMYIYNVQIDVYIIYVYRYR